MATRKQIFDWIRRFLAPVLLALAALLWGISFLNLNTVDAAKEARKVERHLHQRQKILDQYAHKALETPADQWILFEDFPEDMVLYRYNSDTLQCWVNRFPLGNDEVDLIPYWYRLNYISNSNLFATPLAYLQTEEQYVNLGSGWYVVKEYKQGNSLIITGLLVKTEYPSGNSQLRSEVNPRLKLDDYFTTIAISYDFGEVVSGIDGYPLFSLSPAIEGPPQSSLSAGLRWTALVLCIAALFLVHYRRRRWSSYVLMVAGMLVVLAAAITMAARSGRGATIFSPALYADNWYFNSFGALLFTNLFVFFVALGLFMMKVRISKVCLSAKPLARNLILTAMCACVVALAVYIHLTFRSVILNSVIVLQLARLTEITVYSILCYASYATLFCVLLLLLHCVVQIVAAVRGKKASLLSLKPLLIYVAAVSLYSIALVSAYEFKKETDQVTVWTNKFSIERDLQLELHLCSIENTIMQDPYIQVFLRAPAGNAYIQRRLQESYFSSSFFQQYNLTVSTCAGSDKIIVEKGANPVDCYQFFDNEIQKFGTPLTRNSNFFFMNNFNGRIGYLGVFTMYDQYSESHSLFIEIDSKYVRDDMGYPARLLAYQQNERINLPKTYSHAKYIDGRLVSFEGDFNYPIVPTTDFKKGFSINYLDGYTHFVNRISDDNLVVISRQRHKPFPYIVSFSYLFLFFGAVIMTCTRGFRKEHFLRYPRKSFRRKITFLLTAAMVLALVLMAAGSVYFNLTHIREQERQQMIDKINTVQSTLTDHCKYTMRYNEINASELFEAVDRIANNTQSDINLYDPHGRLVRSTKSEIFDQYIISSRINPQAYHEIMYGQSRQCIIPEEIAGIKYNSLYAPIFNVDGTIVTIANVPFFSRGNAFGQSASSIIAALINIYLLLILATIIVGVFVANSLARPMEDIGKKMEALDVTQKAEHIEYYQDDEIGKLVKAYNKMVDDLAISTQKLANSEREQAWREMARQIAHEIKNPLTPMRLSIQHLLRLKSRGYEGWEDKFEEVSSSLLEQIDILSNTATEFSSFAKFYSEESVRFDLLEALHEQVVLFDTRDDIDINTITGGVSSAFVIAKRSQITRVFVNLITNALQAIEMAGVKPGRIDISITELGPDWVMRFEDNGPGVSEKNLPKLFKPNFTTKNSGTGLGLAISRNIIEQSQGTISYAKSSLGGAAFIINLPRA